MLWFEKVIYAFISGLTEFLPISSQAHQAMLLRLFGQESAGAFFQFSIHAAALLALLSCFREELMIYSKELRISGLSKKRRPRQPNKSRMADISYIRTATIPLTIGFFCFPYTTRLLDDLHWMAFFMAVNGVILYLPEHIRRGNKKSLNMTPVDGVLFGAAASLGVIPGISRIGSATTAVAYSGADRQQSMKWVFMISIPALSFALGFDIRDILLTGAGLESFWAFFGVLLCSVFTYIGAFLGIMLLRFLSVNAGYAGFSYYCWGFALFMLVIFLI